MTSKESKEELAEQSQIKTFTNWSNQKLKERDIHIQSVLTDFSSGVNLINLIEILARKSVGKYSREPKMRVHVVENCSKAIQFLMNQEMINLVNISGTDIADGNKKIILALCWQLILVYQVAGKGDPAAGGAAAPAGGSAKAELLAWVRSKIGPTVPGYGFEVDNFTTDWNDGKKLMALVNTCSGNNACPDFNDPKTTPLDKAKKAMSAADDFLDCPPLISPVDMISPNVDELSMMTYLSYLRALDMKKQATKKVDEEKVQLQDALKKARDEQDRLRVQLADQQQKEDQQRALQAQLTQQQEQLAQLQAQLAMKHQQEADAAAAAAAAAVVYDVDDDDDDRPVVRPSNMPPTVVLIVGESGHGKSTFINAVANFFLRGKVTALRVVIDTKYLPQTETRFAGNKTNEREKSNTSQSQTDNCFAYDFVHPEDGRKFVWIDTPGLGDTRGMEQDEINIHKIVDFAASVGSLAGIVIIINGMISRLTTHMKKTLVTLRGHIPDVMLQNIVIVFTMCSNRTRTFDLVSLKELGTGFEFDLASTSHIYHIQNSFFASNPKKWNEEDLEELDREFATSMATVKKIINKVGNLEHVNTQVFNDMKDVQFNIKATLHKAKVELNRLQRLHDDLVAAEKVLGDQSEDAGQFKDYVRKTKVKRTVVIADKGYYSTVCSTCNTVCHEKCSLNEVKGEHQGKGHNSFVKCYALNGKDYCRRCTGLCHYSRHYHSRQGVQEIETDVVTEIEDMKKRFQAAQQGVKAAQGQIDYVEQAKAETERAVKALIEEITKECQHLKTICSGFNFVDELNITIQEMRREAAQLRSAEARKAANLVIDGISQVATNLSK